MSKNDGVPEDWNPEDYAAAIAKLSPKHDGSKKARKSRHKKVDGTTDGRSLKATGRTEQFNFKSTPGLKDRARAAAVREGVSLAIWMERVVESALGDEPTEDSDA
jgi:hypothetical protein